MKVELSSSFPLAISYSPNLQNWQPHVASRSLPFVTHLPACSQDLLHKALGIVSCLAVCINNQGMELLLIKWKTVPELCHRLCMRMCLLNLKIMLLLLTRAAVIAFT